mmetsp:Transcript_3342/g.7842  ORF Transcript_3342/g.7842 Transcript_3342/m.7842 type:complete len:267 (-) Transcript_3342:26-826(-)
MNCAPALRLHPEAPPGYRGKIEACNPPARGEEVPRVVVGVEPYDVRAEHRVENPLALGQAPHHVRRWPRSVHKDPHLGERQLFPDKLGHEERRIAMYPYGGVVHVRGDHLHDGLCYELVDFGVSVPPCLPLFPEVGIGLWHHVVKEAPKDPLAKSQEESPTDNLFWDPHRNTIVLLESGLDRPLFFRLVPETVRAPDPGHAVRRLSLNLSFLEHFHGGQPVPRVIPGHRVLPFLRCWRDFDRQGFGDDHHPLGVFRLPFGRTTQEI